MSGIGIISSQYSALVKTTDDMNDAVILAKKRFYCDTDPGKSKTISFSAQEWNSSKEILSEFIRYLLKLMDAGDNIPSSPLPRKTVEELKELIKAEEDFGKKLKSVNRSLKVDHVLDMQQLDFLDNLVAVLNHERGLLFKKLRTARG